MPLSGVVLRPFQINKNAALNQVVALDVNRSMLAVARRAVECACEDSAARVEFFCGTVDDYAAAKKLETPFIDVLVSEILGTIHTSECMPEYVARVAPYLRVFEGKVFAVPRATLCPTALSIDCVSRFWTLASRPRFL